ncbi:MAG: Rap1a/Tai family immunity protein [Gammaproteobacteria bacterium]|jgi:hypothetical protein
MAKSILITAAILAALLITPVHAEDGKGLKKSCNASSTGYCLGFVSGVYVATPEPFCNPPNIKSNELVGIVTKYLNAHPEKLHMEGGRLVVDAFIEAFPCKEGE